MYTLLLCASVTLAYLVGFRRGSEYVCRRISHRVRKLTSLLLTLAQHKMRTDRERPSRKPRSGN